MSDFDMETIRRVVDNAGKDDIEIRPYSNAPGLVEVYCTETSANYIMYPSQARLVAQAMMLCADEVEAANAA